MILNQLARPFRFIGILLVMLVFLIQMSVVYALVRGRWARVRWSNRVLTRYCQFGLWLLKVHVTPKGLENLRLQGSAFCVGNHLSYMDVLALHSVFPACFVTSKEIKETPVLGQVCTLGGCLFVERRNRGKLLNEVSQIAEGLSEGFNVVVFPEATSTNGEKILPFKRSLFMAAMNAQRPILPFVLNYRRVGKAPINTKTRDKIFWYGDMGFASHLWDLTGSGGIEVDLVFQPALEPNSAADVTALTAAAQAAVERDFIAVPPS